MNKHILNNDVQDFLAQNKERSPQQIALQKSPFLGVTSVELANQIDCYQRALTKLPTWANTKDIYFPLKINIEQSSSEKTALIKQHLVSNGSVLMDLTGGFGVDSYFFSKHCKKVIYCDINKELVDIVNYNASQIGGENMEFHHIDGLALLATIKDNSLDYIYVDPSRRDKYQRYFLLEECQPDIVNNQLLFFQKAKTIISKISPLFDISKAISQLHYCKTVHVISVDSDCKELLFIQEKGFTGAIEVNCIAITAKGIQRLSYQYELEKTMDANYSIVKQYLYDPDVSVLKAGAFKTVAVNYDLSKLHQHSHLYTSSQLVDNFIGRSFEVLKIVPIAELKKKNPYPKAHVQSKNFPMKVDEIRKKYKIKDGGDIYLFFTTDMNEKLVCIACKKA